MTGAPNGTATNPSHQAPPPPPVVPASASLPSSGEYTLHYFTDLLGHPVCETRRDFRIGNLTDLVFRLNEPYPEAVGIFISHGWGNPTEFIPWDRVSRIADGAIFVLPPPATGERYPPFVDQPGWILLNEHLMGKEVLDIEGRQLEIVNDVQLVESRGRMIVAHVDTSFNGFLRRWHLGFLANRKGRLVSWKYVQPLSLEDAVPSDRVSLSVTRSQIGELPSEDLADALEELSGREQEAIFAVLDSEKAAETLADAEPRAQRQLVEDLSPERARAILTELSVAQIADLLEALPLDARNKLINLLSPDEAERTRAILSQHEAKASALMSRDYAAHAASTTARDALVRLRDSGLYPKNLTYLYVVREPDHVLLGVVDLRELVLAHESALLGDLMTTPAVAVEQDVLETEMKALFQKYQFRMLPVVDAADRLLGVVLDKDILS